MLALLLCNGAHASAEPFAPGQALDQRLIADVTAAALAFMAPRTLEPVPMGQLTIWGLRGLSTIDPRLTAELNAQTLRLALGSRTLDARPPPRPDDPRAWGEAAAELSRTAWDVSEPVRRVGTQGVVRGFFDEMLNHLDPYSRYATPLEAAADANRRNGRAGLGIELARTGSFFIVRGVAAESPAAQVGIRPGDTLLAIDGQPLTGADLAAAEALMGGPEDSTALLTLRTPRRGQRVVSLTRVMITPPTVFAQREGDLLVIRITGFARDTADSLSREITRPAPPNRPPRGLVLDLRGNRGGLLRQAVASAEMLVPHGLIAITAGRDPAAAHEYLADGVDLAHDLPVVVMVDGHSASAAEVLAAALADQRRAVVVGSATLGKGLVQTILPLPDGGALSLTWSRILAPLGWPIQALGVLPQVCTSLGEEQLKRQLAELSAGHQLLARALTRHREARAPLPPTDILEIRNACPAGEGRDGDMIAADFLVRTPAAYTTALVPLPMAP